MTAKPIQSRPVRWQALALVCRKCGKKLGGGFGPKGRDDLVEILQDALKQAGRRRSVRIAKVGCLGLCPKNAVAVALADRLLTVPKGTAAPDLLAAVMPRTLLLLLVLAAPLAACATAAPPPGDPRAAAYRTDYAACGDSVPHAVAKRNAKTGLAWFASPVTRWGQIDDGISACMAARGWGRTRACTPDELRRGSRAPNLTVTATGLRCTDPATRS